MYNYTSIKVPKFPRSGERSAAAAVPAIVRGLATLDTCDALPHLSSTYTQYRDRTGILYVLYGKRNYPRDIVCDSVRSGLAVLSRLGFCDIH